jgi:hypothetical protein
MCISKQNSVHVIVHLSPYDKYNYQYSIQKNDASFHLKSFVSSKIRQKIYYEHSLGLRPFWYLWFDNTYYYQEEDCYIKVIYRYLS